MKVYFLSGLGADERVFKFLNLDFCEPVFLSWLEPLPKESLKAYAHRMYKKIEDPSPVIVGVSFGGMLATEMAKINAQAKVLIISSAKTFKELPAYFRMWRKLPVYNWSSHSFLKRVGRPFARWFNGVKGEAQEEVFNDLLNDVDMSFDTWAIGAIVNWRNIVVPPNVTHVHGEDDLLLPFRLVQANKRIKNGTHLMIMNNADEMSALIKNFVETSAV